MKQLATPISTEQRRSDSSRESTVDGSGDRWFLKSGLPVLVLLMLVVGAITFGYQQLFSTFAHYDDEGYVMLSLRNFMQGSPLFDVTYSQYGPAFFQFQAFVHSALSLEITHDIFRFKTLAVWLIASLLAAFAVARMTRSNWIAVAMFGLAFVHLDRFCCEPGHPQELCALCLTSILVLAAFLKSKSSLAIPFLMGVLVAIPLFSKINVGIILGIPVGLAFLISSKDNLLTRAGKMTFFLAAFGLIAMISQKLGFRFASCLLPLTIGCGFLAALVVANRFRDESFEIADSQLVSIVAGFLLATVAIVGMTFMHGTSPAGLADGLVFQHMGFTKFFNAAPLLQMSVVFGIVGLIIAFVAGGNATTETVAFWGRCVLGVTVIGVASYGIVDSFVAPDSGLMDRSLAGLLCSIAPAIAWVILIPQNCDTQSSNQFARILLCLVAVFQPLIAYPIAGTQMALGTLPLLMVGVIAMHDFELAGIPKRAASGVFGAKLRLAGLVCVLLLCTFAFRSVNYIQSRNGLVALDLPGAYRLKLPEEKVAGIREVVERVSQDADTFIFADNTRNSFYFWSKKNPPNEINATVWPYMLNVKQQESIVDSLANFDRILVLRNPRQFKLPGESPLLNWISSNCEYQSDDGPFATWAVKE